MWMRREAGIIHQALPKVRPPRHTVAPQCVTRLAPQPQISGALHDLLRARVDSGVSGGHLRGGEHPAHHHEPVQVEQVSLRVAGPGRYCSPRDRMPFNLSNEGSNACR